MKNQRTIVALLATIAVLLALNLVKGERRAEAGVQRAAESDVQRSGGEPYVAKRNLVTADNIYRSWSDGQLDYSGAVGKACSQWQGMVLAAPVDHDAPVVDADVWTDRTVIQVFADGRVDRLAPFHV